MDLATVLGLMIGMGLVLWAMIEQTHGNLYAFYSTEGVLLVIVGSIAATMISMPMANFLEGFRVFKKCFLAGALPLDKAVDLIVTYATIARKDGMLALENEAKQCPDPFLAKGLQMIIDGQDHDEVETTLRLEVHASNERHAYGKKIFGIMGNYAPAYGLTATIIGQVVMFQNLGSDISKIGGGMSIALLGTLYGALYANIVCLPLADKLGIRAQQEGTLRELMIQGIIAIASDESPSAVKTRLLAFLDARAANRINVSK